MAAAMSRSRIKLPQQRTPRILAPPHRFYHRQRAAPAPAPAKDEAISIGALMNQERRRPGVEAAYNSSPSIGARESVLPIEAELLRAECNFLRMERQAAVKMLGSNRAQTASTLRSVITNLLLVVEKINAEGKGEECAALLEGEISKMEEKITELRGIGQRMRGMTRSCSRRNFDRRAVMLRRRMEKMGEDSCEEEIREISVVPVQSQQEEGEHGGEEVKMVRSTMEGVAGRMKERMEECMRLLVVDTTGSRAYAKLKPREAKFRITRGSLQISSIGASIAKDNEGQLEVAGEEKGRETLDGRKCACRELVERIVEEARTEMEQWSAMQALLDQVRTEMEELRYSHDLWRCRASTSELDLSSMKSQMIEWKRKVIESENKATQLMKMVLELKLELRSFTKGRGLPSSGLLDKLNRGQCPRALDSKENEDQQPLVSLMAKSKKNALVRAPFQELNWGNAN